MNNPNQRVNLTHKNYVPIVTSGASRATMQSIAKALTSPSRVWQRSEVLSLPSPVPRSHGVKEAAELLNVPLRTIRHWRGVGQGPLFHKMERAVRYSREELARFAQGSLRQSTDDREKRQA